MEISKKVEGGKTVVIASGRVDTTTAPELEAALVVDGVTDLVADLTGVPYMSSAGLRCLLSAHKKQKAQGGSFAVVGVQPTVKEVLDITGFSDILTIL